MANPTSGSILQLLGTGYIGTSYGSCDVYYDSAVSAAIAVYKTTNSASGAPFYGNSPMFASWVTIPSDWPTTALQTGSRYLSSSQVSASTDTSYAMGTKIEKIASNKYMVQWHGFQVGNQILGRLIVLNSDGAGVLSWQTSSIITHNYQTSNDMCKLTDYHVGIVTYDSPGGYRQKIYSASRFDQLGQPGDTVVLRATSAAIAGSDRHRVVRLTDYRFVHTSTNAASPPMTAATWNGLSTLTVGTTYTFDTLGTNPQFAGVVGLVMSDGNTIVAYPHGGGAIRMGILDTQTDTIVGLWNHEQIASSANTITDVQLVALDTALDTFAIAWYEQTGTGRVWIQKYRYIPSVKRFFQLTAAKQIKSSTDSFTLSGNFLRSSRVNDDRILFIGTNTSATSNTGIWLVQLNESTNNTPTGSGVPNQFCTIQAKQITVPGGVIRFKT